MFLCLKRCISSFSIGETDFQYNFKFFSRLFNKAKILSGLASCGRDMSLHIEDNREITRFVRTLFVMTLLVVVWRVVCGVLCQLSFFCKVLNALQWSVAHVYWQFEGIVFALSYVAGMFKCLFLIEIMNSSCFACLYRLQTWAGPIQNTNIRKATWNYYFCWCLWHLENTSS